MTPSPPSGPTPDWTITGAPYGDGQVAVWASKALTDAKLTSTAGRHALELTASDFVLFVAPTYDQALRALFESWSPTPDARPIEGRA
ncbi:hypothetical protein ACQSSU_20610 [Micromonospora echinospora]